MTDPSDLWGATDPGDPADLPAFRAALADLAEDGPQQLTSSDLWTAGRRHVPRTDTPTVLLSLAVAASVLLCAFVGWSAVEPTRLIAPAAQSPRGALPATLHAVPARLTTGATGDRADLAVGRSSVAWVGTGGAPVLVDATDGSERVLELPAWGPAQHQGDQNDQDGVVALSPDGWQLAYGWVELGTSTAETTAGLAVVDLRTGKVRRTALTGRNDRPLALTSIRWSPNGRWLAWYADEPVEWTRTSARRSGSQHYTAITPSDDLQGGRTAPHPGTRGTGGAVVDDQGNGWEPAPGTPAAQAQLDRAVISPDGSYLAGGGDRWLLRGADGTSTHLRRPTVQGDKEPLGWTSDSSFVGLANPSGTDDLAMTQIRVDGAQPSEGPIVVTWKRPAPGARLSVATDLVAHGVQEFAEPRWPWSTTRKIGTAALGGFGLLLGATAVLALRRRRRWHHT